VLKAVKKVNSMKPGGLAIDVDGNVYVADGGNHRIQVFQRVLLNCWISMPEGQENPIERRETGGGIGRRSDTACRGMNLANYVGGRTGRAEAVVEEFNVPCLYKTSIDFVILLSFNWASR